MFQNRTQTVEGNGNGSFYNGKENTMFGGVSGNIPPDTEYDGNVGNGRGNISNDHPCLYQPADLYNPYNNSHAAGPSSSSSIPPSIGGLNISNPRYSAMYRNTLLRYSPTENLPPSTTSTTSTTFPRPPPHNMMSVNQHLSSPYHTLHHQQQFIQVESTYYKKVVILLLL